MRVTDLTVEELKALIKEAVGEALENVLGEPGRKEKALDALREIREAFRRSGITEEELQKTGRRIRHKLAKERYGEGRRLRALLQRGSAHWEVEHESDRFER